MSADTDLQSRPEASSRFRTPGCGRAALALTACAAVMLPLAACSSSHHPASTASSKTCQQVAAVLSDGPDPGADKVGYAEAQILPLRQIRTSSPVLRSAISDLADAYNRFFASNGQSAAATSAVAAAAARMNKLCPGAGAAA
jgi:hypothetical protein